MVIRSWPLMTTRGQTGKSVILWSNDIGSHTWALLWSSDLWPLMTTRGHTGKSVILWANNIGSHIWALLWSSVWSSDIWPLMTTRGQTVKSVILWANDIESHIWALLWSSDLWPLMTTRGQTGKSVILWANDIESHIWALLWSSDLWPLMTTRGQTGKSVILWANNIGSHIWALWWSSYLWTLMTTRGQTEKCNFMGKLHVYRKSCMGFIMVIWHLIFPLLYQCDIYCNKLSTWNLSTCYLKQWIFPLKMGRIMPHIDMKIVRLFKTSYRGPVSLLNTSRISRSLDRPTTVYVHNSDIVLMFWVTM
jgi:hypothetical protein